MFWKNLLIAYRNLLKNKMVSFINILGLTFGLASALLAIIYAQHELTYENCHVKNNRIAMVFLSGNFGEITKIPNTFGPEGEAIKNMFPEIEAFTITHNMDAIVRVGDKLFKETKISMADSNAFNIFTIPFIYGSAEKNAETVILSERTAQKYFGAINPLGKQIILNCFGEKINFTITGVYKNFPSNTHLQAELIIPFSLADRFKFLKYTNYDGTNYSNYVLLQPGVDIKALNNKIATTYKIPVKTENIEAFLMPLKDLHFNGPFDNNKGKLMVFLFGGLFVLITSCFNYINLTNILFASRSFETGIRVINGGSRKELFSLFIADSGLSTFIGFAMSIIILLTILPWFNNLMDTHISLTPDWITNLSILILFILTVLLSGLYPAIKFSKNKAINLIKFGGSTMHSRSWSRIILTSFQFFLATVFIQVLFIMNRQNTYINDKNTIGYNPENVICLPGKHWGDLNKVRTELLKNPKTEAVSWCSNIPSMGVPTTDDWISKENKIFVVNQRVDFDFLKVYQIKMEKGRFFSRDYPSDIETGIVINKEAADVLGYKDPIGKTVWVSGKIYNIIGMIGKYMSLPPIFNNMPMILEPCNNQSNNLIIRINPADRQATHEYITQTLQKFNPDYPINIRYHDEVLFDQAEAKSYISANQLMNMFFMLTIFMSVTGLFGLSLFMAQKSRKEVGIRKVCGASGAGLIYKLSKGIFLQGLLAVALATPVSWIFSKGFLSVFPTHFEPGFWFFLTGGSVSLSILMLTISWQTWRAATRNPVEALKYE